MTPDKIRILSTRPLDPALAESAAEQGILLESLAFIETHPIADETLNAKIAELAHGSIVAVFTSMNAVDAVARCVKGEAVPRTAAGNNPFGGIALPWKLFCIGSATRERVIEDFGEGGIAGIADSAAALANTIIAAGGIKQVVFFCGDQRRNELPERLRAAGIGVEELVVYQTRPTPRALTASYDGIVFFSPSAVNSFFSVNTLPASSLLFAIGPTTADAIREHSGNRVIVSEAPGKDTLIRQAIAYFCGQTHSH